MFIALYGINNIGKSTQAKLLVKHLKSKGQKAIYLKYPIYDIEPSGSFINKILRSGGVQSISEQELQMWFALNRYQFQPQLQEYLDKKYTVIAEDYIATSLAWGTAKGASMNWLENLNSHLVQPNLAILIQGPRTLTSIEADHIHENNSALSEKVADILATLATKYNWPIVQKQSLIEDTQNLLRDVVDKRLFLSL